jgi:protein-S-isoprenylcysteine O-methyltransferase Ste14
VGTTLPLIAAWPYNAIFWAVFAGALAPEFLIITRRAEPATSEQDAGSKRLIVIGQIVAVAAVFTIAQKMPSATFPHPEWLFWIGVVSMAAGAVLRRHCWAMLGKSFTGAVIVEPDQAVVERGAYRFVRHPSYTAAALMFVGIALAVGNWIGVLLMAATVAVAYGYRVRVEERALADTIGQPYRDYMTRTKRFVPFVF